MHLRQATAATLAALLAALHGGCSGDSQSQTTTVRRNYNDPLLDRYASNFDYEKGEDGSLRISSNKRSSYEGARAQGWDDSFATARFTGTGEAALAGKQWDEIKTRDRPRWSGRKAASESGSTAAIGTQRPHESGKSATAADKGFATNRVASRTAPEAGARRFDKPRDAATENRRESYPEPVIVGFEEQRRMSLQETRSILGRDRTSDE